MDDETKFALEELRMQNAALREELSRVIGRGIALETGLVTALRCRSESAQETLTEMQRALSVVSSDMARQGVPAEALAEFAAVEETLTACLRGAVSGAPIR